MTATDAALRVVLSVKEVKALTKLRKENEELRRQLNLWRGPTKLPIENEYYTADKTLIEEYGWDFGDSDFAMRYNGIKESNYARQDGTVLHCVDHIFTLPYKYEECNSTTLGTGYIKIGFDTHELHQLLLIEEPWNDLYLYDHVHDD